MVHLDLNISLKTELRVSTQKKRLAGLWWIYHQQMVQHFQTECLLIKKNACVVGLWTDIMNGSKKKSHAHILCSDILVQN